MCRQAQLSGYFTAERRRRNDFDIRAVFEDVEDQLTVVGVGDFEEVVVSVVATLLLRVPAFVGDPAGAFGGEAQQGLVFRFAREDAVAGGEVAIEAQFGNIPGLRPKYPRCADTFQGEGAQRALAVVPGVEVPVIAVVHQPLWRDSALADRIAGSPVVGEMQAPAVEQGVRDLLEGGRFGVARGLWQDANSAGDFLGRLVLASQQFFDPFLEWFDVWRKQPGFEVFEEVMEGEKGVKFVAVKPESREFVARRVRLRIAETIAAPGLVVDDRCILPVAQKFEVAVEGGARNLQFAQERADRHDSARAQHPFNPENPLGLTHRCLPTMA